VSSLDTALQADLDEIDLAGLRRVLRHVESPQGARILCDGQELWNYSSNDYLGLAAHPLLLEAAQRSLADHGHGAGASRLISGTFSEHLALEEALAHFKGTQAALTFGSGFAAAVGVLPALAGSGDVIILDKLSHASLVDGARLSGAQLRVFPHNNLEKLESHLSWARQKFPHARVIVVAESVYSMGGDLAPLREIVELKDRFGAWLMLDEAHGVGVLGNQGRGLADAEGVADRVDIQMGTLGKALGSSGAYICGSRVLADFLVNRARSFIFSTAPPPSVSAAARAAVELLQSPEGTRRIDLLHANLRFFGEAAALGAVLTPIVPIVLGEEEKAVATSHSLRRQGYLVPAVRYPTVARGAAQLRITITAAHERENLQALAAALILA